MHISNSEALKYLIIGEIYNEKNLLDECMRMVVKDVKSFSKSQEWEELAAKHPSLMVKITQSLAEYIEDIK